MSKVYGAKSLGTLSRSVPPFVAGNEANLRERYSRYESYLRREVMGLVFAASDTAVAAAAISRSIADQGDTDARASALALKEPQYAACQTRCISEPKCLIDCVDSYSVTAAKVLGCQILPDGLPY